MSNKDSQKKEIDLTKYKDNQSVSLGKMRFGLWLATNRMRIIRIITIILIIASISMIGYSGYNYTLYFLYGRQADKELTNDLANSFFDVPAYRAATAPQVLLTGPVYSFSVGDRKDFLSTIKNPNPNYHGIFNYCFKDSQGSEVACDTDFILPSSEKFLLITAQEIEGSIGNLELELVNVFWQRLDTRQIPNWEEYSQERLNIAIEDVVYKSPDYSSRVPLHDLSFSVKNNTAYNFSRVPLNIVIWNGNSPVAINVYNLDSVLSSEKKEMQLKWPAGGERATKAEIFVNLNIFDETLYLPYRSDSLR